MSSFFCRDCKNQISVSDGTVVIQCVKCKAMYAIVSLSNEYSLMLSGKDTIGKAKLNADDVRKAIVEYQNKILENFNRPDCPECGKEASFNVERGKGIFCNRCNAFFEPEKYPDFYEYCYTDD